MTGIIVIIMYAVIMLGATLHLQNASGRNTPGGSR